MAHKKNTTNLTELLLQCVTQPDPMLSMLEWLCTELMEAEVDQQLGAEKIQRTDGRSGYRSGYRPRRLDIPEWARCTSWCSRFVRAAIFRSSSIAPSLIQYTRLSGWTHCAKKFV